MHRLNCFYLPSLPYPGCTLNCWMQGLPLTKLAIYSFFVQRVKEHLHLVLCMSPVGDAFRWACISVPTPGTAWCLVAAPSGC